MAGFETPFSQKLSQSNRWVLLAGKISWDNVCNIFTKQVGIIHTGRPPISPRIVIGSLIIKHMCNLDDRETVYKFISSIKITNKSSVSLIVIVLNILVFIIMVFEGLGFISFDGQDLYAWGANYRPAVVNGQWWRLLTNIFLHGGLMHLIFDMYGLLFVSIFLEPILG